MSLYFYISAALAFFATTALILSFRPIARSLGLVDVPNERKVHEGEVPLVGGIAIYVAVVATHVISTWFFPGTGGIEHYTSFYVAGALLVLVGVADDFREVSPRLRLLTEAVAVVLIMIGANVVVRELGTLGFGGQAVTLGILAVPFTIFAVVGVINAVNMSDGLDGLAGTLSLVPIVGFTFATIFMGDGKDLVILCCFAASIIAFLLFNVTVPGKRRALIFLGDSGSMFLGMALAWFAIRLSQGEEAPLSPAAALWFLTLPIFDTACTTIRRAIRKRPLFSPDKEHLHHVFLLAGFTVTETVLIMSGIAAVGVVIGLVGSWLGISDAILAGSFLVLGLMYFWLIIRAWTFMRFLRRSICRRREIGDRRTSSERRRNVAGSAWRGPERRDRERRLGERRNRQRVGSAVSDSGEA